MATIRNQSVPPSFLNLKHAGWVVRVLGMLMAVVGRDSLLGLVLGQARTEIASVLRDTGARAFENN
jgi:hypothetical protein